MIYNTQDYQISFFEDKLKVWFVDKSIHKIYVKKFSLYSQALYYYEDKLAFVHNYEHNKTKFNFNRKQYLKEVLELK